MKSLKKTGFVLIALLLSCCANNSKQILVKDSFGLKESVSDILKNGYGFYVNSNTSILSTTEFKKFELVIIGETEPNIEIKLATLGMKKYSRLLFNKIVILQIGSNVSCPSREEPCMISNEYSTIEGNQLNCVINTYGKEADYSAIAKAYIDASKIESIYLMENNLAKDFPDKLIKLAFKSVAANSDTEAGNSQAEQTDQKTNDNINRENSVEAPPPAGNINNDDSGEVFSYVEEMPEFPGGQESLMQFIAQNIKYPDVAKENGIEGKVYVQFVVFSNGKADRINVLRGIDPSLDAEAVRVIKQFPLWNPGKQNGKPVNVSMTLPVQFKLE